MSMVAIGPNGNALLALSNSENAAIARCNRLLNAMRHERADRISEIRNKLITGEINLNDVTPSNSGITTQWAIPKQIPLGPYSGKWCIPVPADESKIYQRDPKTGKITSRPSPEWAGAEIVEDDPDWWPQEILNDE